MPQMQLSALRYTITFTDISGPWNSIQADSFNLVNFGFQRGTDDQGMIVTDYSLFDQDAYEAGLKTMLNGMTANLAVNLGAAVADVRAALSVSRTWFFFGAAPVGGSYAGTTFADQMAYP